MVRWSHNEGFLLVEMSVKETKCLQGHITGSGRNRRNNNVLKRHVEWTHLAKSISTFILLFYQ
jgi:hypothetical protein